MPTHNARGSRKRNIILLLVFVSFTKGNGKPANLIGCDVSTGLNPECCSNPESCCSYPKHLLYTCDNKTADTAIQQIWQQNCCQQKLLQDKNNKKASIKKNTAFVSVAKHTKVSKMFNKRPVFHNPQPPAFVDFEPKGWKRSFEQVKNSTESDISDSSSDEEDDPELRPLFENPKPGSFDDLGESRKYQSEAEKKSDDSVKSDDKKVQDDNSGDGISVGEKNLGKGSSSKPDKGTGEAVFPTTNPPTVKPLIKVAGNGFLFEGDMILPREDIDLFLQKEGLDDDPKRGRRRKYERRWLHYTIPYVIEDSLLADNQKEKSTPLDALFSGDDGDNNNKEKQKSSKNDKGQEKNKEKDGDKLEMAKNIIKGISKSIQNEEDNKGDNTNNKANENEKVQNGEVAKDKENGGNKTKDEEETYTEWKLRVEKERQEDIKKLKNKEATESCGNNCNDKFINDKFVSECSSNTSGKSDSLECAIKAAINTWSVRSCIKFKKVEPASTKEYLLIKKGENCTANVGRTHGDRSVVTLNEGCKGKFVHLLGHAIGLYHEQSRFDRDDHVKILWKNIPKEFHSNFAKYHRFIDEPEVEYRTHYDINSVMHYKIDEFARPGTHSITTPPHFVKVGDKEKAKNYGGSAAPTPEDLANVINLYKCFKSSEDETPF